MLDLSGREAALHLPKKRAPESARRSQLLQEESKSGVVGGLSVGIHVQAFAFFFFGHTQADDHALAVLFSPRTPSCVGA